MLGELVHNALMKFANGALDISGLKKIICEKLETHLDQAQEVVKTKSAEEVDKFFADARAELEKWKAL